ncbi:MAG: hypothetical protein FJ308_14020 [Planctomycetes bacterium]|nr:hypothetical protein [Planctomycetota bacterium]
MIPRDSKSRGAFSLLEVMIATAILAGSAMVLFSLIGLGTRYGNRSESRIAALVQAQSILDESIARISAGDTTAKYSGELIGPPPRSYQISIEPVPAEEDSKDWNDSEPPQLAEEATLSGPTPQKTTSLVRVTVKLFDGATINSAATTSSEPIISLTRWIRVQSPATNDPNGIVSPATAGSRGFP